jgi:hypothetical protein
MFAELGDDLTGAAVLGGWADAVAGLRPAMVIGSA